MAGRHHAGSGHRRGQCRRHRRGRHVHDELSAVRPIDAAGLRAEHDYRAGQLGRRPDRRAYAGPMGSALPRLDDGRPELARTPSPGLRAEPRCGGAAPVQGLSARARSSGWSRERQKS